MNATAAPLHIADLSTANQWIGFDIDSDLDMRYRGVTGWDGDDSAAGMSIVAARRAFTRGRPLPPGGVLLGIELDSHDTLPADGHCEFRVETDVTRHRSGFPFVQIVTTLRVPDGKEFAEVVYVIRWPRD